LKLLSIVLGNQKSALQKEVLSFFLLLGINILQRLWYWSRTTFHHWKSRIKVVVLSRVYAKMDPLQQLNSTAAVKIVKSRKKFCLTYI